MSNSIDFVEVDDLLYLENTGDAVGYAAMLRDDLGTDWREMLRNCGFTDNQIDLLDQID